MSLSGFYAHFEVCHVHCELANTLTRVLLKLLSVLEKKLSGKMKEVAAFLFYKYRVFQAEKALNLICFRASLLCVNTDSGRQWCLQCDDQNQTTDTGWVCLFPLPTEQKAHIYFYFTCSQLRKEVTDEEGGEGLRQEMTSMSCATQLKILIKNGKLATGEKQCDLDMLVKEKHLF